MSARRFRYVAVLVFSLLSPLVAHAGSQRKESTEAQEHAARKACLTGDVAKGVEILADLYLASRDPIYIFNQGRCFEQNRRYEDAIARFREYLIKAERPSSDEKADAERHIAACQSYLGEGREAGPATTTQAPGPEPSVGPPEQAPPPPALVVPLPAPAPPAGAGLRTAGIVTASVGGAALIAGVVLNLKVNSMTSDLEQPYNYSRGTDSTRKDYKTLGWIGYSVGAAGVLTGAVLYYLGRRKAHDRSPAVGWLPTVSPAGAGALLVGGF